ncbi:MAG: hypothetical protein RR182_02060, partial [Alistipes sp.]
SLIVLEHSLVALAGRVVAKVISTVTLRPLDRLEDREFLIHSACCSVTFATSRQARGSYIAPPPSLKKFPIATSYWEFWMAQTPQTPQTPQHNYYRITSCTQRTPPDVPAPFNK